MAEAVFSINRAVVQAADVLGSPGNAVDLELQPSGNRERKGNAVNVGKVTTSLKVRVESFVSGELGENEVREGHLDLDSAASATDISGVDQNLNVFVADGVEDDGNAAALGKVLVESHVVEASVGKDDLSSAIRTNGATISKEVTVCDSRGSKDTLRTSVGHIDVSLSAEDGGVLKSSRAGLRGAGAGVHQNIFLGGLESVNDEHRGEDTGGGDSDYKGNESQSYKRGKSHEGESE